MNHKPIDEQIKQVKFESEFQRSIINIFYTSNFFRDVHGKIFSSYKLQSQHFNVLRILKGKNPAPVQPGYIKEVMLDKGCDLTRLMDKLEKYGYINREIDKTNKRRINITLTPLGLVTVDKISLTLNQLTEKYKDNLSEEEHKTLSHLLDRFRGK